MNYLEWNDLFREFKILICENQLTMSNFLKFSRLGKFADLRFYFIINGFTNKNIFFSYFGWSF